VAWPLQILFVIVMGMMLAGGVLAFDVLSRLPAVGAIARIHEAIPVPGGLLRVDRVIAEHMAAMQAQNFAKGGMPMSGMGMDMAPEGYRRFTVDVTLSAQARNGLHYTAEQFYVTGEGVSATAPLRHSFVTGVIPEGSNVVGTMLFQVPEAAGDLQLHFGEDTPAIILGLEPANHAHEAVPNRQDAQESSDHAH
jgi:hypothetical protein